MNRRSNPAWFPIVVVLMLLNGVAGAAPVKAGAAGPELNNLTNYPRVEKFQHGSVQVDFPSLESWPGFRHLKAWLPVEVALNGDARVRVGAAYVQALTDINFEQRTVAISDLKVLETSFPDEDRSEARDDLVSMAFQGRESIVPLDVLLRLLPEDFEIPGQPADVSGLNFDPPLIIVSEKSLKLLSIDKKPVKAPIEGTQLQYVVNSNWNVFYYPPDEQWYVLNDNTWQQGNYLAGVDWLTTEKLPADFAKLPAGGRWQEVQQALPASKPSNPPVPFVVTLEETELILLDGPPRLTVIEGTGISYVSNTGSDLFSFEDSWFFLVSGRWFSNTVLMGPWRSVDTLPDAFAQIPASHLKGHVLYSVPGTRQAKLALIEAALPHRKVVAKTPGAKLDVTWVGEPRFEAIDNTQLQRGLNTPFQVIRHNSFYYLCYEGAWYLSDSPSGDWKAALNVPEEIYRIPPTDPAYNVTFVRLDSQQDETRDHVSYSYSSGYTGSFSTRVSVVYGTGWHYPSAVYWDSSDGPVYWRYGQTYGYNTGYQPVGAYYGHRGGYYGRWGYESYGGRGYGARTTVTIEYPSVSYTQGYGSAWEGPLQTTPGDPSDVRDKSLEKFLPKKKTDGTEKFVKTRKDAASGTAKISASSLYANTSLSSNRIAGPNGEVYKREDQQWSRYDDGNWSTMQAIAQDQPIEVRPQQKAATGNLQEWLPAHKRTLSRSELDRQELARLEGMDQYSKYRMTQEDK